jgi:hypothetical protein
MRLEISFSEMFQAPPCIQVNNLYHCDLLELLVHELLHQILKNVSMVKFHGIRRFVLNVNLTHHEHFNLDHSSYPLGDYQRGESQLITQLPLPCSLFSLLYLFSLCCRQLSYLNFLPCFFSYIIFPCLVKIAILLFLLSTFVPCSFSYIFFLCLLQIVPTLLYHSLLPALN